MMIASISPVSCGGKNNDRNTVHKGACEPAATKKKHNLMES